MGRPRRIVEMNKRHFTNAEIEERQNTEKFFKLNREQLLPSVSLSPRAKAEFERIVNEAYWIDNLDRNDLILYCFYWDNVANLVEKYDDCPEKRKAIKEYHAEMRAISLKLGLSSIDRLKLVAPKNEKPKNKFLEILDNG